MKLEFPTVFLETNRKKADELIKFDWYINCIATSDNQLILCNTIICLSYTINEIALNEWHTRELLLLWLSKKTDFCLKISRFLLWYQILLHAICLQTTFGRIKRLKNCHYNKRIFDWHSFFFFLIFGVGAKSIEKLAHLVKKFAFKKQHFPFSNNWLFAC